jgi:hypothetical protein
MAAWPSGGTVVARASPTEIHVQPPDGVTPTANLGDWYTVGVAGDTGLRVRTDGAGARLRVGIASANDGILGGVTATPQMRLRDTEMDAFAGVTVRLPALTSADLSIWEGVGERDRLLGPMQTPDPAKVLTPQPLLVWTSAHVAQAERANTSLLAVVHRPTAQTCLPAQHPELDHGFDPVNARLLSVPDSIGLLFGGGIGAEVSAPGATGRIRMENLLRRPDDPNHGTERGYMHITIDTAFPPIFAFASGWRNPDLAGGVDMEQIDTFLGRPVSHWQPGCTRITATGGPLVLGRVVIVNYSGPLSPFSPPRFEWNISDIWFLTLAPSGTDPGELLLHSPASIWADDNRDQGLEIAVNSATTTSRIFSVGIDDHKAGLVANSCRRAATEVMGWALALTAEIQLQGVAGEFAVKLPNLSLVSDQYQDDKTTAGQWWMGAYGAILGFDTAQFGSSVGTIDMRSSPFPPYWA